MMNKITWANKAKKDLREIPKNQKMQIYQAISTLSKPQ
jgi:mRNA-degrading endonuclease RelE of RelBE toxin-antitoxin system